MVHPSMSHDDIKCKLIEEHAASRTELLRACYPNLDLFDYVEPAIDRMIEEILELRTYEDIDKWLRVHRKVSLQEWIDTL
jgi:hypothetical protein